MKFDNTLVGDIGGTKTILAIVETDGDQSELKFEKKYRSNDYSGIEEILNEYFENIPINIKNVCLAVAGPTDGKQTKFTNLPWVINSQKIIDKFNFNSFQLINDLEAIALAIPMLTAKDLIAVHEGEEVMDGTIAVIAPGTGLGEAYLTFNNGRYVAHASEGSHASFSPINSEQIQLLEYFQKKGHEHVSFERVCSGAIGIPNLYEFVRDVFDLEEPQWFADKLKNTNDITPLIIEIAQNQPDECPRCKKVLDLFCDILAVEAGNLALKVLSTGGIYLAGGISAKIINRLSDPAFIQTLQNKGRFGELLMRMSIKVITNPNVGLIGAAQYLITKND